MERNPQQDEKFTRYLLSDLTEEERARLEEEYFTDDELFENYLCVKDELLDAYARGDLTGQQRERFEKHFLSTPPRRERLREAKELIAFTTMAPATEAAALERQSGARWWSSLLSALRGPSPAFGFALAVVLLIAALGGVWMLIRRPQSQPPQHASVTPPSAPEIVSPPQPDNKSAENLEGSRPAQNTSPPTHPARPSPDVVARRPAPRSTTRVASILLTPILTRDVGPSNTLRVRPDTSAARLQIFFKGGTHHAYSAMLQTIDGEQVWRSASLKARPSGQGKSVIVNIPATVFRKKDYIITLSGKTAEGEMKEINEYFFTVQKD